MMPIATGGASDTLFQSFIDGGFEPFFRLGGESGCGVRKHDFNGSKYETQENQWITGALKIAQRYTHWQGNNHVIQYLDIITEWLKEVFWDGPNNVNELVPSGTYWCKLEVDGKI